MAVFCASKICLEVTHITGVTQALFSCFYLVTSIQFKTTEILIKLPYLRFSDDCPFSFKPKAHILIALLRRLDEDFLLSYFFEFFHSFFSPTVLLFSKNHYINALINNRYHIYINKRGILCYATIHMEVNTLILEVIEVNHPDDLD